MRNRFAGPCYRCTETVPAGAGHFERFRGGWRVQHAACAVEHRGTPDPEREADRLHKLEYWARQTGPKAQLARKTLREMAAI